MTAPLSRFGTARAAPLPPRRNLACCSDDAPPAIEPALAGRPPCAAMRGDAGRPPRGRRLDRLACRPHVAGRPALGLVRRVRGVVRRSRFPPRQATDLGVWSRRPNGGPSTFEQALKISPTVEAADHYHVSFFDHDGYRHSPSPRNRAEARSEINAWRPPTSVGSNPVRSNFQLKCAQGATLERMPASWAKSLIPQWNPGEIAPMLAPQAHDK